MTKNKNLVVSGGFFLNTVFNGKIIKQSNFKDLYIPYAPSDTGNSIGSALYLYHDILNQKKKENNNSPFVGFKFEKKDILKSIQRRKINFKVIKDHHKFIAMKCYENKIIGFFNGKFEFGDRALGSRSILGNPTSKNIKDLISTNIPLLSQRKILILKLAPTLGNQSL